MKRDVKKRRRYGKFKMFNWRFRGNNGWEFLRIVGKK